MEKLEKRIIEIRENINFLNQEMNEMYSAYEIAKDKKISGYASLEQKMACGVGNCQGCVVLCITHLFH